jgi:thiol-disulfide isomerase/thioredoxin
MSKLRYLIVGFLAAVLGGHIPTAMAAEPKAINFNFTTKDGKTIKLSDYRGKWVVVNFWAPWCQLCRLEVPALNALDQRKDTVVIGVGMDYGPDVASVENAVRNLNMRYQAQVLGGSRRDPYSAYRQVGPVDFYPTSYLYSPDGDIVMFIPGQMKTQQVLALMEGHKSAKSINEDQAQPLGDLNKARIAARF